MPGGAVGGSQGVIVTNMTRDTWHCIPLEYSGGALDKDRNDQSTPAKLVDAGFMVSDQFWGKNMFDFLF